MAFQKIRRRVGGLLVAVSLVATPGPGAILPTQAGKVAPSPTLEPGPADVTIILRPVKSKYCRGEQVTVDCVMSNVSAHNYDIFRSYMNDFCPTGPEQRLHVAVTRDGQKVPRTCYGGSLGVASGSYKGFGPGSRDTRRFFLNAIYDMTLTGEYRITAALPVNGVTSPGRETPSFLAMSAPVVVLVVSDCP